MSKRLSTFMITLMVFLVLALVLTWVVSELRAVVRDEKTLQTAFSSFTFAFQPVDIFIGSAIAGLIILSTVRPRKKYRMNIEHGSARWGNKRDIRPFTDPDPENNIILTETEQLTLNERPKNPANARNLHVCVVGGSGSGKTRFFIKPNLMQCASKDYPVSFVVTDPKGTLITETGKMLRKYGYEIKVFNTINFKKSMHYNPFAYIRSEKDMLSLVTALMENTKGEGTSSGEDFWVKAEQLLYLALIGYIYYEAPAEEQNFATLIELIGNMEVREDDEDYKNAVDYMFDDLEAKNPDHFAVSQYKRFKLAAGKTAKSILISCAARLAPFDIGELREITLYDELELDMLGDRKQALFFVISDTDKTYNFIVSLAYSQMFNRLCERADDVYGGRLPVHVRFLLDEFANIGKIPNFERLIATIRSRRISACIVLQSQAQLKSIYKDEADTIIDNCDSYLFLGGGGKTTLKDISERLGKETIDTINTGETRGRETSTSKNDQKLGRELMTLDELATMPGDQCIYILRGVHPFRSKKFNITKHPRYDLLADADKRNAFDVEKYLSTNLKLRPEDEYLVVEIGDEDQ